ncbi:MAG: hypothetical protein DRI88_02980 [Bacteroidetes bacterium]|nr:MAG: hypothetical protein DRI88_02980 [Bacteroidota bacterium]
MKQLIFLSILVFTLVMSGCTNSNNKQVSTDVVKNSKSAVPHAEEGTKPMITFGETEHDLGDVIQGEKVTYNFTFHNTGGTDLLITRVSTSCGCTVGKYPKEMIKPGEGGDIEVTFDTHRRKGIQHKTVTVLANTEPNKTILRIKANVVLPQNQ